MIAAASMHSQPTVWEQIAVICLVTGVLWWLYVLTRGALVLVIVALFVVGWLLRVALILMARGFLWAENEHYRRVERVRRYTQREAAHGRG